MLTVGCHAARLIRRSTSRFIRAGVISSSTASTAGRGSPAPPIGSTPHARARAEFDLAIVSVLLDAGAGPGWRFRDVASGREIGAFGGACARQPRNVCRRRFSRPIRRAPLRADAGTLAATHGRGAPHGLQVDRRQSVCRACRRGPICCAGSAARRAAPAVFARKDEPRPGGLFDHLAGLASGRSHSRPPPSCANCWIHLGPIWPSRIVARAAFRSAIAGVTPR